MRVTSLCLLLISLTMLSACASKKKPVDLTGAAYWQRINVQESVYLTGQRAQKILNRNIATCTNDIKAMQTDRLLREAIPADTAPYEDEDTRHLRQWDSPERDRALRLEHYNYHDFESCMEYHGWRRIETLTQEDLTRAKKNYQEYRDRTSYAY